MGLTYQTRGGDGATGKAELDMLCEEYEDEDDDDDDDGRVVSIVC